LAEDAESFEADGVVDYDHIVFGTNAIPLKGIMLAPTPSVGMTLQILAAWHTAKLVNDTDVSYWTLEEPALLIRACKMHMETDLHRNSEGRRDYEAPLLMELRQIYHDFVQEEMSGPASRWVMKG
jgi:hypothetical protein